MNLGLDGNVALVAASSRGLGFAAARQLVQEGARVVICGRNAGSVDRAVDALQAESRHTPGAVGLVADVSMPADVERLIAHAVDTFGSLDILITNAGGPPGGTFDSITVEQWEKGIELTLMSAVRLIQAALPHLRESEAPSILTITSISVKQPVAGLLLSNALRPGVVGMTKTLSRELSTDGIRVNSILPGWTRTERIDELMAYRAEANNTSVDDGLGKVTASIPLGRMAKPEEFGRVAAFLVSPASSYVTGVMLQVDGGSFKGLL